MNEIEIIIQGFKNYDQLSEKPVLNEDCISAHDYKEKSCFVTTNRICK